MLIMLPRAMLRVCGKACHLPFGLWPAAMRESGTKWQDYALSKAVITGAAALALVAGATAVGVVITSSPVDGNAVIHGCYTNQALNGTHVFALQDAGNNMPQGHHSDLLEPDRASRRDRASGTRRHAGSGQDHQERQDQRDPLVPRGSAFRIGR